MTARPLRLALTLLLLAAAPALAGPPWIAIEIPANPFHEQTRDAFLVVRTYHHGNPIALQVTGTAEGIVGGERVTRALRFERTRTAGLWTLRAGPPEEGTWVLVITGGDGEYAATAVVEIGQGGEVARVSVPRRSLPYPGPRPVSGAEIDALLEARAEGRVAPALAARGDAAAALATVGPWALLLAGAAVAIVLGARRRR